MKVNCFSGHIVFRDNLEEFNNKLSIYVNVLKITNFYTEAHIMLEVYQKLQKINYTKPYDKIIVITNNLQLQRLLIKQKFSHTDITQDAGTILKQIKYIREKLTIEIKVKYLSRENRQFNFLL